MLYHNNNKNELKTTNELCQKTFKDFKNVLSQSFESEFNNNNTEESNNEGMYEESNKINNSNSPLLRSEQSIENDNGNSLSEKKLNNAIIIKEDKNINKNKYNGIEITSLDVFDEHHNSITTIDKNDNKIEDKSISYKTR